MGGGSAAEVAAAPTGVRRDDGMKLMYMKAGRDSLGRRQQRIPLGWVQMSAAEAEAERDSRMKRRARKDGVLRGRLSAPAAPAGACWEDEPRPLTRKQKMDELKRLARTDAVLCRRTLEDLTRDSEPKQPRSRDTEVVTDGEEWAGLEPFFFDEAEAIADHKRRAPREKQKEKLMSAIDRIRAYDPKLGRVVYNRIYSVNLLAFDHDEESPLGPMRDTDASIDMVDDIVCKEGRKHLAQGDESSSALSVKAAYSYVSDQFVQDDEASNTLSVKAAYSDVSEKLFVPCNSANVLSVKIVSSDVGFPIEVYGTVIARDCLDLKSVYIFHRDRDHSHIILTKDEELILIGPKRGLALVDCIYFEIDLKIKGEGKRKKDKQLSKGFLILDGVSRHFQDEMEVESYPLDSMLSKVVVMCAVEKRAIEATVAIEVVQGKFYGEITACTTNILDRIVLHDSKLISEEMTGGVLPMLRRVVAVGLMEKLMVTISRSGVCKAERERTINFTPRVNNGDEAEITCGSLKMRVKVTWSIIKRLHLD